MHMQVSLGFLLFGDQNSASVFLLQKLIILSQNPPSGKGLVQQNAQNFSSGILRNYTQINPDNWRENVIEALAIIRAKKVIRKLGLSWMDIYYEYLPHVAEISTHLHPLLKALYKICERLTPEQAGQLINHINGRYENCQNLRFYDSAYLEVFLLNWITNRVIVLGDKNLNDYNVDVLVEFFKLNDMDTFKDLLLETIKFQNNQKAEQSNTNQQDDSADVSETLRDSGISVNRKSYISEENAAEALTVNEFDEAERYKISRENAGYVLIINQNQFYKETDPKLQVSKKYFCCF